MNNLLERGAFVLSIDTELDEGSSRYFICREVVSALIELMENFEIRATWAVPGYMFLDKCYFDSNANRLALTRGRKVDLSSNSLAENFYSQLINGRDTLQQIMSCKVPQEIGCHTLFHMRVGHPSCGRERFESDLKTCKSAAEAMGLTLRSFVFPFNSVGHLNSLRRYGYIAYRSPSPDWYAGLPTNLLRLAFLLDHWLVIPSPAAVATCEKGIWNMPASYYYACGAGWGKMIPISLRINKVKKGLHLAARKRSLFHLWFHPFDLTRRNPQAWLKGLKKIFAEFCRYRDAGLLDNYTMGNLAHALEYQKERINGAERRKSISVAGMAQGSGE